MPLLLPPAQCPVCRKGKEFLFIKDYPLKEGDFSLYECRDCKVQFYLPFNKVARQQYESMLSYQIREFVKPKITRGYHKKFLQKYGELLEGATILDVGCGTGEFLNELQKRGSNVFGVDFDANAVALAKKYFNLKNVVSESFEDFFKKHATLQFDFITAFEIIQYVDDPFSLLEAMKKALKPGGTIIISVPARDRMLSGFQRWDLPSFYCLTRWNKEALVKALSRFGLAPIFSTQLEEIRLLAEAISSKSRLGLVNASAAVSKQHQQSFWWLAKTVYILGRLKEALFGTIPALIFWLFSKAAGKNNGIIYAEFR